MVVVAESIQITKSCLSAKARSFMCNQLENYEERGGGGGGVRAFYIGPRWVDVLAKVSYWFSVKKIE